MYRQSWSRSLAVAMAAVSLLTASAAGAAPVSAPVRSLNPLVALSMFGSVQSRAALCAASSTAVTAAAAQMSQGPQGCVLPVADVPPPPVVSEVAPPLAAAPAPLVAKSTSLLPFFFGLGALAVFVALVDRDNRGRIVFQVPPPDSPS